MSQLCICEESQQTRSSESIPDAQQDPLHAFLKPLEPLSLNLLQGPLPTLSLPPEIPDSQDFNLSLETQPSYTNARDTSRDERIAI